MFLIKQQDTGYLNFSIEDGVIFNELKDTFNAQSINDEEVKFDTFNTSKAVKNPIVVAYNNSDTMIPELQIVYSKEILKSDLKAKVVTLKECATIDKYTYFPSDTEIDEFVENLNGISDSLSLIQNDYEVVVTAFVVGGSDE